MISDERADELQELLMSETSEEYTQEWRDGLSDEEWDLVGQWESQYCKGMKAICERILELSK